MILKEKLFFYVQEKIKSNTLNFFFKILLNFIAFFWFFLVFFKNFLYDKNILRPYRAKKICVISIGNIVAGGTGKTPFTIFLAKRLAEEKMAIISRGYKSKAVKQKEPLVATSSENVSAEEIGDEPFLLLEELKLPVIIGKDRIASLKALQKLQTKIALLDDAMQCRYLYKDFEIVLLNGLDLFGQNHFLPRGFLRDSPKSLKRASLIVLSNIQSEDHFLRLKKIVELYSKAPIIGIKTIRAGFFDQHHSKVLLADKEKIAAFCAIANPGPFFDLLQEAKLEIVNKLILLDHEKILDEHLNKFMQDSYNLKAQYVICTQKDIVKIDNQKKYLLPIIYLKTEVEIVADQKVFDQFLKDIKSKLVNALA